jgi:hypothetical protein
MAATVGAELKDDAVAIYEIDGPNRKEILVSGADILRLHRAIPRLLSAIAASKLPLGPGHSSALVVPMEDIQVVPDLHSMVVLLNVKDAAGGDFHYSISPKRARDLADVLARKAAEVDEKNKTLSRN